MFVYLLLLLSSLRYGRTQNSAIRLGNNSNKLVSELIPKMSVERFKVEKFNGSNDFGLWCIKMKAFIVQNGLNGTLDGEVALAPTLTVVEKRYIMAKTLSMI